MVKTIYNDYEEQPLFERIDTQYCDGKHLKMMCKHISDVINNYYEKIALSDYEYEELTNILYNTELISLYIRKALDTKETQNKSLICEKDNKDNLEKGYLIDDEIMYEKLKKNNEKIALKNLPVEFNFDGKLVKIYTPLTFKRAYSKINFISNYLLSNYLQTAITDWQNQNKINLYLKIKTPYILVMKRMLKKFNINKVCDCDNLENQKIINTITQGFGLSDNAMMMSLYSMFDECVNGEKEGMYFYLFAEDDLEKYSYLLKKQSKKETLYLGEN